MKKPSLIKNSAGQKELDFFTGKEITNQPKLWLNIWKSIHGMRDTLSEFLNPIFQNKKYNILLTGAGSSSFIGKSIQHLFRKNFETNVTAVSTTSLVTHFENYVSANTPLLMIHFARSGNSPESVATLKIAEKSCNEIKHLAITCNAEGNLAKYVGSLENGCVYTLPAEAEDRGLAMTGSFTGMLLSAILITQFDQIEHLENEIKKVSKSAETFLETHIRALIKIAGYEFQRIVFLGSGPLLNIARESHLKVQELTDGHVISKHDSFLGFRHGPRAVVNKKTIIVYLFSHNPHVFKYEKDLAEQIRDSGEHFITVGVFPSSDQINIAPCDHPLFLETEIDDQLHDLIIPLYVLPAQILGYYKSLNLGFNPDTPSNSNTISRVVKGVTIYPRT